MFALFAAVLVLIIAIVFGLSTDYEIFLLSRMVEARQKGASTTEAIRVGTAHTGRIITAAAAILVVVTGAFALSDIVMMKYIAFGMIAALILDALASPGTYKEIAERCGLERHAVARRLKELETAGRVRRTADEREGCAVWEAA